MNISDESHRIQMTIAQTTLQASNCLIHKGKKDAELQEMVENIKLFDNGSAADKVGHDHRPAALAFDAALMNTKRRVQIIAEELKRSAADVVFLRKRDCSIISYVFRRFSDG